MMRVTTMMMIFDDDIDQINVLESSFIDDEYDCPSQRYNPLVQDKNQRLLASLILSNSREGKGKPYVYWRVRMKLDCV